MSGKCPCEECISLAICVNRYRIECEILYHFICKTRKNYSGRVTYIDRNQTNIELTKQVLNKSFHGSNINRMATSWGSPTNVRTVYGNDQFNKKNSIKSPMKIT